MPADVGSLIREARIAAGLTQADLAERASTSQPAVAAYESGTRTPVLATLSRLLAACGREIVLDTRALPSSRVLRELRELRLLRGLHTESPTSVFWIGGTRGRNLR